MTPTKAQFTATIIDGLAWRKTERELAQKRDADRLYYAYAKQNHDKYLRSLKKSGRMARGRAT